jgi:hypothetical protein
MMMRKTRNWIKMKLWIKIVKIKRRINKKDMIRKYQNQPFPIKKDK